MQVYEISAEPEEMREKRFRGPVNLWMVSKQKTISLKKVLKQLHWQKRRLVAAYRAACLPPMSEQFYIEENDARGDEQMSNYEIPYWKKYTLSIEEAYIFRIGKENFK